MCTHVLGKASTVVLHNISQECFVRMTSYGRKNSSGGILILTLRVLCWNKFLRINFHSYIRGTKQGTKKELFIHYLVKGGHFYAKVISKGFCNCNVCRNSGTLCRIYIVSSQGVRIYRQILIVPFQLFAPAELCIK